MVPTWHLHLKLGVALLWLCLVLYISYINYYKPFHDSTNVKIWKWIIYIRKKTKVKEKQLKWNDPNILSWTYAYRITYRYELRIYNGSEQTVNKKDGYKIVLNVNEEWPLTIILNCRYTGNRVIGRPKEMW